MPAAIVALVAGMALGRGMLGPRWGRSTLAVLATWYYRWDTSPAAAPCSTHRKGATRRRRTCSGMSSSRPWRDRRHRMRRVRSCIRIRPLRRRHNPLVCIRTVLGINIGIDVKGGGLLMQ